MSFSICRHVCCTHISKMPRCAFYFPIFYCQCCFWEEERRKGRGEPQTNVYIYFFFAKCTPNANYTVKLAEGHNLLHK